MINIANNREASTTYDESLSFTLDFCQNIKGIIFMSLGRQYAGNTHTYYKNLPLVASFL